VTAAAGALGRVLRVSFAAVFVAGIALAVGVGAAVALTDRTAFVVVSGSMAPTLHTGDLVVVERDSTAGYRPGEVITYREAARGRITHRVVGRTADGEYRTRGDANRVDDSDPVPAAAVDGRVRWVVPMAGRPLLWAGEGMAGFLRLAALAVAAMAGTAALAGRPGRAPGATGAPVCLAAPPPS
jgi:signal peptidase